MPALSVDNVLQVLGKDIRACTLREQIADISRSFDPCVSNDTHTHGAQTQNTQKTPLASKSHPIPDTSEDPSKTVEIQM